MLVKVKDSIYNISSKIKACILKLFYFFNLSAPVKITTQ